MSHLTQAIYRTIHVTTDTKQRMVCKRIKAFAPIICPIIEIARNEFGACST